jgi:hypothetical protein
MEGKLDRRRQSSPPDPNLDKAAATLPCLFLQIVIFYSRHTAFNMSFFYEFDNCPVARRARKVIN